MKNPSPSSQNYINHIALVIDASSSIAYYGLAPTVVKVADDLIAHLARRSKDMDQETRVTIYLFNDRVKCVIFDKDVLRLPSLQQYYQASGSTALVDATVLSIEDLRQTMVKYGDHAFLSYVLTDGEDNQSSIQNLRNINKILTSLADNETVAVLVPDERNAMIVEQFGFPKDNIAVWEVTKQGLEDVGTKITRSVDTYMSNRVLGVRSTKSVFSTDSTAVNTKTVNSKKLTPLPRDAYTLLDVKASTPSFVIRDFVETETGTAYKIGTAYYQLTKTEIIQTSKSIAIQNKHSGRVYTGTEARAVLGLPDVDARVKPNANDEYRIYVQSTSVNRKLVPGTKLLLLK